VGTNGAKATTKGTWKIPPMTVKSDDCMVYVGRVVVGGEITQPGTAYPVHVGESIQIIPTQNLREMILLTELGDASLRTADTLKELCTEISKRIISWDWTDMRGEKMADPTDPKTLEMLTDDELAWLVATAQGVETQEERKNA
jgi:hypothetical protein